MADPFVTVLAIRNLIESFFLIINIHQSLSGQLPFIKTPFLEHPYLGLHHSRPLRSQDLDSLEHIHHTLITHTLQHNAQRREHPRPSYARATMYSDRPVLAELLLGLVHLADEIDETFTRLGDALLGPVGELELAHRWNGVDLQMDFANATLTNLNRIWQRPVHLQTCFEGKAVRLSCRDQEMSMEEITADERHEFVASALPQES